MGLNMTNLEKEVYRKGYLRGLKESVNFEEASNITDELYDEVAEILNRKFKKLTNIANYYMEDEEMWDELEDAIENYDVDSSSPENFLESPAGKVFEKSFETKLRDIIEEEKLERKKEGDEERKVHKEFQARCNAAAKEFKQVIGRGKFGHSKDVIILDDRYLSDDLDDILAACKNSEDFTDEEKRIAKEIGKKYKVTPVIPTGTSGYMIF